MRFIKFADLGFRTVRTVQLDHIIELRQDVDESKFFIHVRNVGTQLEISIDTYEMLLRIVLDQR
jgi:hypothetical protein